MIWTFSGSLIPRFWRTCQSCYKSKDIHDIHENIMIIIMMYGYPYSGVLTEIPPCCDLAPTGLLSTHDRTFRKMSIRQCIARDLRKWYRHVITMYHNFRQQKATSKFLDSRCCKYKPISTAEELKNLLEHIYISDCISTLYWSVNTMGYLCRHDIENSRWTFQVPSCPNLVQCFLLLPYFCFSSNIIQCDSTNKHGTKMYQTRFFAQISANLKQIYVHPGLLDSCPSLKLLRTQLRCPWPIKSWTSQTRDGLGTRQKNSYDLSIANRQVVWCIRKDTNIINYIHCIIQLCQYATRLFTS